MNKGSQLYAQSHWKIHMLKHLKVARMARTGMVTSDALRGPLWLQWASSSGEIGLQLSQYGLDCKRGRNSGPLRSSISLPFPIMADPGWASGDASKNTVEPVTFSKKEIVRGACKTTSPSPSTFPHHTGGTREPRWASNGGTSSIQVSRQHFS